MRIARLSIFPRRWESASARNAAHAVMPTFARMTMMAAAVGRVAIVALALSVGSAQAATDIDLFFPVPVQGKLANEMQRLIEQFDKDHADIHVTAVYTGSYDDTN